MVETTTIRRRASLLGFLCTLFVAGGLLLILLMILLHTPIPPFPESGGGGTGNGIEVNLGFADAGSGNIQNEASMPTKSASGAKAEDEKILTQETEEAPSINSNDKSKKHKKETVAPVQTQKKEAEKPQQVVNTKALYPAHSSQASSNGDRTGKGDQGDPNGSLGAKAFGGQAGKGGSGGGTGGGVGKGTGTGSGTGVSFSLAGRTPQSLPHPEYRQQVEGNVVVEVTVDKDGRVTQAEPGKRGTTTTDGGLWDSARRAALQARFDRKPDAPAFQKGTITYRFRLQ
ncbi:MAG: TonB family protein [Bacteroidota bacterium]|nr:TonB family protein [Bacteroidota bacterium]